MSLRIVRQLQDAPGGRHIVTIGNFDGVHAGHQYLLGEVVRHAAGKGVRSAAITFDPLPSEVLAPDRAPTRLSTIEDRLTAIAACGIRTIVAMRFDQHVARLEPAEFVNQIDRALRPVEFVVGEDFAFGYQRKGTPELMREIGRDRGFGVTVVHRVDEDGDEMSSTAIRQHIAAGQMERAAALLRRPYSVRGRVVPGNRRGRGLGFPTANLEPDFRLALPPDGIYAAQVTIDQLRPLRPAIVYVGTRPTFNETERVVEVHLLDFDEDLYDREILVMFVRQVREDQRFGSLDDLVDQMRQDEQDARAMLQRLPDDWPGSSALALFGVESVTTW